MAKAKFNLSKKNKNSLISILVIALFVLGVIIAIGISSLLNSKKSLGGRPKAAGYGTPTPTYPWRPPNPSPTPTYGLRPTSTPVANPPRITEVSPGAAVPGSVITIKGTGLGYGGRICRVLADRTNCVGIFDIYEWAPTQITAKLTSVELMGEGQIYIYNNQNVASNRLSFASYYPPVIYDATATSYPGGLIVVNGKNFGATQGNNRALCFRSNNGTMVCNPPYLVISLWTDTRITARIYEGDRSYFGRGVLSVSYLGYPSNTKPFNFLSKNPSPIVTKTFPSPGLKY